MTDVRWKQRFENFEKALGYLQKSLSEDYHLFDDRSKKGIIQEFEVAYELAWKTMKDYLEDSGIVLETSTPKETLEKALNAKLIQDHETWLKMVLWRNKLAHAYSEETFERSLTVFDEEFLPCMESLCYFLRKHA